MSSGWGKWFWGLCGWMLQRRSAGSRSLLFHMLRVVRSSAQKQAAAPPQGRAACAMPNDPCHITTHDASLPREQRFITPKKWSIHTELFVESRAAEIQHDPQLQIICIMSQHLNTQRWNSFIYTDTHCDLFSHCDSPISPTSLIKNPLTLTIKIFSKQVEVRYDLLYNLIWRELSSVETETDGSSRCGSLHHVAEVGSGRHSALTEWRYKRLNLICF